MIKNVVNAANGANVGIHRDRRDTLIFSHRNIVDGVNDADVEDVFKEF